jgi:hypothetical protein
MSDWNPAAGGSESSRRRSQRVILSVGVTISGQAGPQKTQFSEDTRTLVVNVHGALVTLSAKVEKGNIVVLVNRATREEQPCSVVYLGPTAEGKTQVGLEFTEPAPDFWHIAFPVENSATPAQRRTTGSQAKLIGSK